MEKKNITIEHHLVIVNSRVHLEIQMAGKKSTAAVSTVSYQNFMTSIAVVLHMNIPSAEHENFMIHLTTQHWRNTLCIREKKREPGAEVMFLLLTRVRTTALLCLQQVTEMRLIQLNPAGIEEQTNKARSSLYFPTSLKQAFLPVILQAESGKSN